MAKCTRFSAKLTRCFVPLRAHIKMLLHFCAQTNVKFTKCSDIMKINILEKIIQKMEFQTSSAIVPAKCKRIISCNNTANCVYLHGKKAFHASCLRACYNHKMLHKKEINSLTIKSQMNQNGIEIEQSDPYKREKIEYNFHSTG